ncbi:MAG: sugar phosphate isomerase/epimerase family protein, partial [Anaerovoracaceae bacterium]
RAASVAEAKLKIAKTAALGGKYIRLPGGPAYKDAVENTEETIKNMVECFEQCIPVAKEYGIRILFENDSQPPSWKEPNFCFDIERFQKTWKELKKLDIGFNFDTGNAFFLDDWSAILMPALDRVESLHITDYNWDGKTLKKTVFGQGTVPIRKMLQIIKDNGFEGAICMEDTTFQGLEGTAASYRYVRNICDELFG